MNSLNRSKNTLENSSLAEDSWNTKQLLLLCGLRKKNPANVKGAQRKEFTRSSKTLFEVAFDRVHKPG